jgi:hypothetical protein
MTATQKQLLEKPLSKLPLNKGLVELLEFHGHKTMNDVLEKDISFLRKNHGLSIHDELELFKFVKENGLREMWKG